MRASIIIAAHNEGASLWKTIRSCVESIGKLDYEIVIADDASDDGSVAEATQRFPQLSVTGTSDGKALRLPNTWAPASRAAKCWYSLTGTAIPSLVPSNG